MINNLEVFQNNHQLNNAFCGGLNSPVISPINLNNDAYLDLFIFDKYGFKIMTFINQGPGKYPTYLYAPQYESSFPKDIEGWAVIRDYNKDNIPDIFALTNAGIKVYTGIIANSKLTYYLQSSQLMYSFGGNDVNIWTFMDDLPVFDDINNDGDLDILTFNLFGGSAIEYYENQTIELGFGNDSLLFTLESTCWGGIAESAQNFSLFLNYCKKELPINSQPSSRHQGGVLNVFDKDFDGDKDLLLSDVNNTNLVYGHNGGDSSFANIVSIDSTFPSYNVPVNLPIFPGMYFNDVNHDNRKDLLLAPYYSALQMGISKDIAPIELYKNKKLTNLEEFTFAGDTFFNNQILDFGSNSVPVITDVDKDGKKDILVGISGTFNPSGFEIARLAYVKNISTNDTARFEVISNNWCNLSQFNFKGIYPAVGDLDGDSLSDLILGDSFGVIHFFKNNGSATPYTTVTTSQLAGIDVGSNARPYIYDVNGDGLNDLLIGNKDGRIHYYWNHGTPTAPIFNRDSVNDFFGEVRVNKFYLNLLTGNAHPSVTVENGQKMLYVGSERGLIFKYEIDQTKLKAGAFTQLDSNFLKYHVGNTSTIAIGDLNNDNRQDYIIGNIRGGLQLFSDTTWKGGINNSLENLSKINNWFDVYPNPTKDMLFIESNFINKNAELTMVDINGRLVWQQEFTDKTIISTKDFPTGIYVVRVAHEDGVSAKKVVILK
jgi:hypothetical protein